MYKRGVGVDHWEKMVQGQSERRETKQEVDSSEWSWIRDTKDT